MHSRSERITLATILKHLSYDYKDFLCIYTKKHACLWKGLIILKITGLWPLSRQRSFGFRGREGIQIKFVPEEGIVSDLSQPFSIEAVIM
jgi:hypothetical protein